ncbi:YhgE/Pip domain-containing protein [Gulosibacter sp. 10]|uniref:YhgE/Pip domain-containing protein n=1 Tax=Gulosibacter sp. 10 TaxID=1255570 RepID=UPI00097F5DAD|nr:YhgE/Pip domain-containing protein [Gulosibacter sp. 10]SJM54600.1 Membrane protein [Gulosibacter sp. 10]
MSATTRHASGFGGARTRNLLLAVLLPIALLAAYFAALGGADERSNALPALIVNNDEMVTQSNPDGTETQVVAGRLLVSWLTDSANIDRFDWRLVSPETAEQELAAGDAYVAVTIPEDFSSAVLSLSGGEPRSARIDITANQSSDWATGAVSQELFEGLTAEFGQTITSTVALGLADGMNESADGLQEAADGAHELAGGAGELGDGFDQFLDGNEQLAEGAGQAHDGAVQFSQGAGDLASGADEYVSGVSTFAGGVEEYVSGVGSYADGVGSYVEGVDTFAGGAQELASGIEQLDGGSAALQEGAGAFGDMADRLEEYGPGIAEVANALGQLGPVLDGLEEYDPAQLGVYCDQLEAVSPESAQECRDAVEQLVGAIDASGVDLDAIRSGLDQAVEQLDQLSGSGEGLGQLAEGIVQYTDGVSQLNDGAQQLSGGAGELIAGGAELTGGSQELGTAGQQLVDGGRQLVENGPQLVDGTQQLSDGASSLVDGLGELRDGQDQLIEGGQQLGDGIGELEDGATTMGDGLQEGADQARNAIGDPEEFAEVLSAPVEAETVREGAPGFGGVLGAIGTAVGIWLAALITALRRRIVTRDQLDSSASTLSIFLAAARRLTLPVAIVGVVLAVIPHVFLGAPWSGFLGSVLIALLAAVTVSAVHLLLAMLMGRRNAAIASVLLLLFQCLLIRGFFPLELRGAWVSTVAGFFPLPQAATAMQTVLAGGSAATVFACLAGLVLIAVIGLLLAVIALRRARRRPVDPLISGARAA